MPTNNSVKAALSLIENDKSKILGLSVGKHVNIEPGLHIPKADAQSEPEISFASASPEKTYLIINIDLDAPFASFSVLSPALHWIQSDLKPTPAADGNGLTLLKPPATAPFIVNYIGPGPPPPCAPHRYLFLLYEQPEGFDAKEYAPARGKPVGISRRIRFDLDAWEKKLKLGPVVAVNYFTSN
ncbi:putative protease inhibitor [Daldinia caldariorum]|uniref:putative protease inhibitor n=1 Tax=Daldinia caldariorum TaxID=326644 RepID=UPI00200802C2|nr:putative protease inhibitor [Daldinia caldariorum]KAI1470556.1 putative protease inhibitor [Daldinia caldariorum]